MQEETVNLKQQIMEILKPQLTVKSKIEYTCEQNIKSKLFRILKTTNTNEEIKTNLLNGITSIDILSRNILNMLYSGYLCEEVHIVSYSTNDRFKILIDDCFIQMSKEKQRESSEEQIEQIERKCILSLKENLETMNNQIKMFKYFNQRNDIIQNAIYYCVLKEYASAYDLLAKHKIHNELYIYLCILLDKNITEFEITSEDEDDYLRQLYFLIKYSEIKSVDLKCIFRSYNNFNTSNPLIKAVIELHFFNFLSLHFTAARRMVLCMFTCATIFYENEIYELCNECIKAIEAEKLPVEIKRYLEKINKKF